MSKEKLTKEELDFLAAQYNIYSFDNLQELPEQGDKNVVVFLREDNGTRFVVKKYARDFTPEITSTQLLLNDYLFSRGVPTPRVFPNVSGNLLTVQGTSLYSLMSFIEGHNPAVDNQEEIDLAFEGLARFNAIAADFQAADYTGLPRFSSTNRQLLEKVLPHLPKNPVDTAGIYVVSQVPKVMEMIRTVEKRIDSIQHPKQLIHGDFNLGCSLVKDGILRGIVDYDLVRPDWRGVDAIHTVDLYCFDKETKGLTLHERVDWDKMKRCFVVYKRWDPEIMEQVPHLPLMLANIGLNSLAGTWGEGYLPESTLADKSYFSRRYDFFNTRVEIALGLEEELVRALEDA
ncbi:phosphotransferase [Candidatus Woesearchaeota archaeon]|nr:phosphotransferase [Candidatus Woesearchaeota archaeon]